ncbi:MAG: hypothetical protein QM767_09295 [Anaeromyxobacter sp.]
MRSLVLLPLAAALACAMPQTTVKTTDTRPSILVQGAPRNAFLFVDGLNAGNAYDVEGPLAIRVEPGTHTVEVRSPDGTVLHRQQVFVESEQKTIIMGEP